MASKVAAPQRPAKNQPPARQRRKEPVLGVTAYENARSFMIAVVLALVFLVAYLFILYLSQLEPVVEDRVALELIEIPGGALDGDPNETLKVDSPEPPTQDAAVTDIEAEVTEMEETLDNVIDVADQATSQAPPQYEVSYDTSGKPGSATGTGRRALGSGGDGAGLPREQRWYVRFSDTGTIDTYAQQLDFFKIQFGLLTTDGRLIYVSNFTKPKPDTQTVNTGANEKRLYMTWQGGGRKSADIQLFQKAGVDARTGTIFHFYPPAVEQNLARLELAYRNKPVEEIRRTYFIVEDEGTGYKFTVNRQTYLQ
jgi:hypothetical protein